MNRIIQALSGVSCLVAAAPVAAQDRTVVTASAETQQLSRDFGSVNTVRLEYKVEDGDTTVVFTPKAGERRIGSFDRSAVGVESALYHRWGGGVSTRTAVAVAQDRGVFAHLDVAQDVTVALFDRTTLTVGGRVARYQFDQDVIFASVGVRRYFDGGSVAYRLTRADPDSRDAFLAHMVDVSVRDGEGAGQTRLWLSTGAAAQMLTEFDRDPDAQDRGAQLQRTQPLTPRISLIALAGVSSYARSAGRVTGANFGLGVAVGAR